MASLYRPASGVLLHAASRRTVSPSVRHSAILSSAVLSSEPIETFRGSEIFDIFDAPVQLRERNNCGEPLKALHTLSVAHLTSGTDSSYSKSIHRDALGLPWSLPPPITFDGPACPPHMSPSALRNRRLKRQDLTHSSSGVHQSSAVSCSAFKPQSQPLCELFDGPSRIVRYPYPTSQNERYSFTYVSLALCISSAFGWLVLKDNLDLQQRRSP